MSVKYFSLHSILHWKVVNKIFKALFNRQLTDKWKKNLLNVQTAFSVHVQDNFASKRDKAFQKNDFELG